MIRLHEIELSWIFSAEVEHPVSQFCLVSLIYQILYMRIKNSATNEEFKITVNGGVEVI